MRSVTEGCSSQAVLQTHSKAIYTIYCIAEIQYLVSGWISIYSLFSLGVTGIYSHRNLRCICTQLFLAWGAYRPTKITDLILKSVYELKICKSIKFKFIQKIIFETILIKKFKIKARRSGTCY